MTRVVAMKWRAARAIVISMTSMSGHRLFQDDLPSVSISRLRASGVVTSDMESVVVAFGEGDDALRRQVASHTMVFRTGAAGAIFVCPSCVAPLPNA